MVKSRHSSLAPITKEQAFKYCDAELFGRMSGGKCEHLIENYPDCDYIGIFKGEDLIGYWTIFPLTDTTVDIHIHMRQEHRKHNKDVGRDFLDFIFSHKWINKVSAEIASIYPEVIKYTENNGLKIEGLLKEHKTKHGQLVDCYLLGLTRGDYERLRSNV